MFNGVKIRTWTELATIFKLYGITVAESAAKVRGGRVAHPVPAGLPLATAHRAVRPFTPFRPTAVYWKHWKQAKTWVWSGDTKITYCRPAHGNARKSHRTLTGTRHKERNQSQATMELSLPHQDDNKTRMGTQQCTTKTVLTPFVWGTSANIGEMSQCASFHLGRNCFPKSIVYNTEVQLAPWAHICSNLWKVATFSDA